MAELQLDFAVPAADLAPYVSRFYRFAADVPYFEDVERADRAQLRFRLNGGSVDYLFDTGHAYAAPPRHLIGPTCGATRTRASGPVRVFGLGLTAAGWGAMVGLDASAVRGTVLDADRLWRTDVAAIDLTLRAARDLNAMVAIAEPFLRTLIDKRHESTLAFVAAVDAWLASEPTPLRALEDATGLSRRQLERRCNRLYGFPPKLLARKRRALAAAAVLASGADATEPALLDRFYDQSHMIREVKQFAGLTPRTLRIDPGPLACLAAHRAPDRTEALSRTAPHPAA